MNKKTKGLVAGIAGGALLLGTAGTFALWSDSETIGGAHVTGGTFELTATDVQWELRPLTGEGTAIVPPAGVRLVPGVELRGSVPIDVALKGDLLKAELNVALGDGEADPTDVTSWLDIQWAFGENKAEGPTATFNDTLEGNAGGNLMVTVSLKNQDGYDADDRGSDIAGNTWAPDDMTITLQQVPPTFP